MLVTKINDTKSLAVESYNTPVVGEPTLEDAKAKYEADLANGEMVGNIELVHHRMVQEYRSSNK